MLDKLKEIFGLKKKKEEKVPEKVEERIEEKVEEIHEEELRKEVVLPGTEHLEAIETVAEVEAKEKAEAEKVEKAVEVEIIKPKIYPADPVIKAPEIGLKTARVLQSAGITTINDLLNLPIREIQERLAKVGKRVYRATIYKWKIETKLMMEIPTLRIRDVKYLYEIRIRSRKDLLKYTPEELMKRIEAFLNTREGQALAKHYDPPTLEDVKRWIEDAKKAEEVIPECKVVF